MKAVLYTILSLALLAIGASAGFVYTGLFNVAATEAHWPLTYWVMETARVRSIKAHASGIVPPAGFDDRAKLPAAVGHFSEHCAICHGGPGQKSHDIAKGMYPQPPDLKDASKRFTPAELFWIMKNGIKMTGMPSMADDGDDLLWATVAVLQKLPGMSADEYNELWLESQAEQGHEGHGGMSGQHDHQHDAGKDSSTPPAEGTAVPPPKQDDRP